MSGYRDSEPRTRAGRIAAARKPLRLYPRDVPAGATLVIRVGFTGQTVREEVELASAEKVRGGYLITVRRSDGETSSRRQAANCKLDVKKGTV